MYPSTADAIWTIEHRTWRTRTRTWKRRGAQTTRRTGIPESSKKTHQQQPNAQYLPMHNSQQYSQQQYGQQQQYCQPAPPEGQAFNRSNPVKRVNNWNYCHTHGFDIEDHHNSSNCQNPGQYYVWTVMRANPCNGSRRKMHKTQLSGQRGF